MGEMYYGAPIYRSEFISMLTRMVLGNFGPDKLTNFRSTKGDRVLGFISPDTRQIASQAVANAIVLQYSSRYRDLVKLMIDKNGFYILPKDTGKLSNVSVEEQLKIPAEFSVSKMILQKNSKLTGLPVDSLIEIPGEVAQRWIFYTDKYFSSGDNANTDYYRKLNDYHLGLKVYGYLQMMGLKQYLDCLKTKMTQWDKASWDDKIILLECNR